MSSNPDVLRHLPVPIPLTQIAAFRTTIFASAIFVSAFLLFQVQPLMGKFILPWFGGSPAVWTTCMLFFQVTLFLGYAYAHAISRWLSPRHQRMVHLGLIACAMAVLPIAPNSAWKPTDNSPPAARILLLLTTTVGCRPTSGLACFFSSRSCVAHARSGLGTFPFRWKISSLICPLKWLLRLGSGRCGCYFPHAVVSCSSQPPMK